MKLPADLYLLTCNRLPARINVEQTAFLLGFAEHDIPILVRKKLLKPLGDPASNAPKYFATSEVLDYPRTADGLTRQRKPRLTTGSQKGQNFTPIRRKKANPHEFVLGIVDCQ